MTPKEASKIDGDPPSRLSEWKKRYGLDLSSFKTDDDFRLWKLANVKPKGRRKGKADASMPALAPPTREAEGDDTWDSRLSRIRSNEREASRALQAAIKGGMVMQVPVLLKAHSSAVEAVATAEKLATDARKYTGELASRSDFLASMTEILSPIRQALDNLPTTLRARCNPERPELAHAVLEEWRDKLMATIAGNKEGL